jgi:hypothetical protein
MTKNIIPDEIERPLASFSPNYLSQKKKILKWRADNKEYVTTYNREYQRKLRQDPVKYQEMRMRVELRAYLVGKWKRSYKIVSALGLDRIQFAQKYNTDEAGLKELLKTVEIDHIIPATWFHDAKNTHLKPFQYRHYNMQLVQKKSNRSKHSWIDENDPRVKYVITKMELDYANSNNSYNKASIARIEELSAEAYRLEKIIKILKNAK